MRDNDDDGWRALQVAVGDNVRRERLRANLTQQGLADAADVSRAVIQRIEQGTGAPGLRQLWLIARTLGVPADALLRRPQA